jgi:subtilase family serine protease
VKSSSCITSSLPTQLSIITIAASLLVTGFSASAQSAPELVLGPRSRIQQQMDSRLTAAIQGSVRRDLASSQDLGAVEDALPLRLYMVLQRTPEQQAALDNLLARQQQPTAPEFHKWLTPQEFGKRFGASQEDIAKITNWLEAMGMRVNGVQNNATFIDFIATAAQVRAVFQTQLHYFNVKGRKYPALTRDPLIPAAMAPVVAGIMGLNKIPRRPNHSKVRQASYDSVTHRWHNFNTGLSPAYNDGLGDYNVTPQDLYTIYNVNKVFTTGNLAKTSTIAVIEESDIEYGSVNPNTGVATGGDVATFRSTFGVPGTLNMHVYHGYGSVTCSNPGIDPDGNGEDIEASLDAEWANALAPSANLIFMSCDQNQDQGITTSMMALIDNNLADVMSLSYGGGELEFTSADFSAQDSMYAQAASQGQSILISSGDSGSDVADQNTAGTATSGFNVNGFGAPNVTMTGGTDFVDTYDSIEGGAPQSTYWGNTNSSYYGDALSYVPETAWNDSCASSILANYEGYSGAGYCALGPNQNPFIDGDVVGGSGGFSTHYSVPSYQSGILGYSGTKRAQPDIAGFASAGFWGHALVFCDSYQSGVDCSSSSSFGLAGGTSFVAPYMAGMTGLLIDYTSSRQGLLNPALYALARTQFTAAGTAHACYSNGQTSNTGVTSSLPVSTCTFNDVTSSNNDVPCQMGSTNCYVNPGASYGMLSLNGSNSLSVGYPSTPGYDEVSGIGTVNAYNLLSNWNSAFTSSTNLTASPASISSSQSTTLTATVVGGTPTGFTGSAPALVGIVGFASSNSSLGSCTLTGGTCSINVNASSLQSGSNSITASYNGSRNYPPSTSTMETVTVTSGSGQAQTITFTPIASQKVGTLVALNASASSGLPVSFASSTSAICTVSGTTADLIATGTCTIVASQAGNGTYASATPVSQSFTVTTTAGLGFIQVTPCRVVDTRQATGSLGGPSLSAGSSRSFPLPVGPCGLPSNASAYSVNVTVVPKTKLNYLTIWPTGQPQPVVSTLNSLDGRIVANAAIVPAGTSGEVNVYATDQTDVIIDINGYFGAAGTSGALSFVPVTPCRVVDTRAATGTFGGPALAASASRSFPVPSSACSIPGSASAYSLNATALPKTTLNYLTLYATGASQPVVSTLNSGNGQVVANAAIVPAGTSGAVSAYATNQTNFLMDINGYFTSTPSIPLVFNAVTPCRVADTRSASGPLGGPIMAANSTRSFPVPSSACGIPSGASAYALNVTVVPTSTLSYLTLWPTGQSQPTVSTLNSNEGQIVANAALVPAGSAGAVDVFVTNQTQVILDIVGYFSSAP